MKSERIKYGKNKSGNQRYKYRSTNKVKVERVNDCRMSIRMFCIFLYYKNMSYRKIGELMDVSHVSVYNWVKQYSSHVAQNFKLSEVTEITDIEIDELYTYFKKKTDKIYVMTAVDRNTYQLIDFDVVESLKQSEFNKFLDGIVEDDSIQINDYHTDAAPQYIKYFKKKKVDDKHLSHTSTKDETTQVESFNSIIRGSLAPLVRRTKVVTRSVTNLYNNLYTSFVFYNKKIKSIVDFLKFSCTFVPEIDLTGCIYFK